MNLNGCKLADPNNVPEDLLRENKSRLLRFVELEAHNRAYELEIWAVRVLAQVGGQADAQRLRSLSLSVGETMMEVEPHKLKTTDRPVKAAYAEAIATLKGKESM